jgi:hypothetical protein
MTASKSWPADRMPPAARTGLADGNAARGASGGRPFRAVAQTPPSGAAPANDRPALIVVSDTEVEFDWAAPFDRRSFGVGHMRHIGRLQTICERWGIRPVYVVDYPIACQAGSVAALRPIIDDGRALLGAHLHPWVTPPHEEAINARNSFPGNLPPALERAKLAALTDCIETKFGRRPEIYKAGRYGLGANTRRTIEELGFTIDLSAAPPFDYTADGGPDFSRHGRAASWVGPGGAVLSIPGTGALIGSLPSRRLYRAATTRAMTRLHVPGILSRLGVVERLRLTPEGHDASEMIRLLRWLHARGERLFVMSLHSPSLEPGHTPYVRDDAALAKFLQSIDDVFAFFMTRLGGRATDPLAVRHGLLAANPAG